MNKIGLLCAFALLLNACQSANEKQSETEQSTTLSQDTVQLKDLPSAEFPFSIVDVYHQYKAEKNQNLPVFVIEQGIWQASNTVANVDFTGSYASNASAALVVNRKSTENGMEIIETAQFSMTKKGEEYLLFIAENTVSGGLKEKGRLTAYTLDQAGKIGAPYTDFLPKDFSLSYFLKASYKHKLQTPLEEIVSINYEINLGDYSLITRLNTNWLISEILNNKVVEKQYKQIQTAIEKEAEKLSWNKQTGAFEYAKR